MSTAIGITLFVIGVGALLFSIFMDDRPRARERPAIGGTHGEATGARPAGAVLGEREVAVTPGKDLEAAEEAAAPEPGSEPEPEAPAEPATPETGPAAVLARLVGEPVPTLAEEGTSVQARMARLRAELGRRPVSEPAGGLEPGQVAPAETPTRADAAWVFGAVASIGRGPGGEGLGAPEALVRERTGAEVEAPGGPGHHHRLPIADQGELLAHLRREHPDLGPLGSSVQARVLHRRAHGSSD